MENAIRSFVMMLPVVLGYLGLVVVLGAVAWFLYGRRGAKPARVAKGKVTDNVPEPTSQPEPESTSRPKPEATSPPGSEPASQPKSQPAGEPQAPGWKAVEQSDAEVEDALQQKGLQLLMDGKHEELEAWLTKIDDQTLRHGAWKLAVFYQALGHYHERPDFDPQQSYQSLIDAAQAWTQAVPQSRYAPVGLASGHLGQAWFMAYDEEGWARKKYGEDLVKHFSEEINKANASFADAAEELWENPHFYATMLVMALATDMPGENVTEYFARGKACRQDYIPLYISTAQWHLPRWHGTDGEDWVKWLEEAVGDLPEDQADIMYARVALKLIGLMFYYEDHNPFTEDGLSWERVRRGGYKALERYPESTQLPSTFLMAAHQANDPEIAASLITQMQGRADVDYWPSEEHLQTVTTWATGKS